MKAPYDGHGDVDDDDGHGDVDDDDGHGDVGLSQGKIAIHIPRPGQAQLHTLWLPWWVWHKTKQSNQPTKCRKSMP